MTINELQKGCGKEIRHSVTNVITICRGESTDVFIESAEQLTQEGIKKVCMAPDYVFELCDECKAKLEGYELALKEIKKIFPTEINSTCPKCNYEMKWKVPKELLSQFSPLTKKGEK